MKNQDINILVVGAGAIGGYFGGRLSQVGVNVSVICRSNYEEVKENGFDIKSIHGDFKFHPAQVLQASSEYKNVVDYLIVTLKVLPEINVIELIKDAVSLSTVIVLIQNGINIEQKIKDFFPNNEILSVIAYIGVGQVALGKIVHQDYGRLTIGKYPKGKSEKANKLSELFKSSKVLCQTVENIIYYRWLKLVWNIPYNHLSVLGNCATTKDIMNNPRSVELVINLMKEVAKLAELEGYKLSDNVIQENIDFTLAMQPYKTSMLLDYENNRPMEIEAIIGNTVRIAEKLNVEIPNIKAVYAMIEVVVR